jgi:hypothetical protein
MGNLLEKIEEYFEFYDMDFEIKRENKWYYIKSKRYNVSANTLNGVLVAMAYELKL